jgi:hypothetical protein
MDNHTSHAAFCAVSFTPTFATTCVRCSDDAHANARKVLVLREGRFQTLQWREVRVGDVVKVAGGEELPADVVFLAAGHEDPDQRGVCHVQTAQVRALTASPPLSVHFHD